MARTFRIVSLLGLLCLVGANDYADYSWQPHNTYGVIPNQATGPPATAPPAPVSAPPSPTQPSATGAPIPKEPEDYAVKPGEFPFMVSLRGDYGHFCGGVLLTPTHVLTAARCFAKFATQWNNQLTATTGIIYQPEVSPANTVGIQRVIYHADFNEYDNNIAILKLANSTTGTLPGSTRSLGWGGQAVVGQALTAVGWGITGPQDYPMPSVPYQLYKTQLRLAKPEECSSAEGFGRGIGKLCAVSHNLTVCKNDVGGPLVDVSQPKPKIVGLVSHAIRGCPVPGPVVLTEVRHFADWINGAVEAADTPQKPFAQGKCLGDCGQTAAKKQTYMIDFYYGRYAAEMIKNSGHRLVNEKIIPVDYPGNSDAAADSRSVDAFAEDPEDTVANSQSDSLGQVSARIINGVDAEDGFNFIVSIRHNSNHVCGGSLLPDLRSVITAAHCVHERYGDRVPARDLTVAVGIRRRTNVPRSNIIAVRQAVVQPDYHRQRIRNDIAILRLSGGAAGKDNVSSVKLPPANREPDVETVLHTAGWGQTREGPYGLASDQLLQTMLKVVDRRVCQRALNAGKIPPSQICTENAESGTCNGDSGGPLVNRRSDGDYLVGITSYGVTGCRRGTADAFTKVSYFTEWIQRRSGWRNTYRKYGRTPDQATHNPSSTDDPSTGGRRCG
ncbi:transmembrane protease serine 9-like [Paramacrobiotus metropolitanus]|uniref:transmembrane protease serine 9-like n=1 Tax=Paramacrobiotus metropolitanus TaxID=2943436 RepID=UPI002445A947|nr:transmembrane protease serine 9-like [Paramacrobiotus metropolitanus]